MSKWKKLLSAALVTGMVCSMPGFSAFAAEVAQAAAGDFVVLSDADDGQNRYLTTPNSNAFNVASTFPLQSSRIPRASSSSTLLAKS